MAAPSAGYKLTSSLDIDRPGEWIANLAPHHVVHPVVVAPVGLYRCDAGGRIIDFETLIDYIAVIVVDTVEIMVIFYTTCRTILLKHNDKAAETDITYPFHYVAVIRIKIWPIRIFRFINRTGVYCSISDCKSFEPLASLDFKTVQGEILRPNPSREKYRSLQ